MGFKRFMQALGLSTTIAVGAFSAAYALNRETFDSDWSSAQVNQRLAFWEADKQFGSPWDEPMQVLHQLARKTHEQKGKPLDSIDRINLDKALNELPGRLDEASRSFARRTNQLAKKEPLDFSLEETTLRQRSANFVVMHMGRVAGHYVDEINRNAPGTNAQNPLR